MHNIEEGVAWSGFAEPDLAIHVERSSWLPLEDIIVDA